MFEGFVLGFLSLWLVELFLFGLLISAVTYEKFGFGLVLTALAAAVAQFAGGIDLIGGFTANPVMGAVVIAAYFILGIIWATIKLRLFARTEEMCSQIKEAFTNFVNSRKQHYISGFNGEKWLPAVNARGVRGDETPEYIAFVDKFVAPSQEAFFDSDYNPLQPSKNKLRLLNWIVFWVPSAFWTCTHDLFKGVWNRIYSLLSKLYEKIARDAVRKALT